jgi:LCP family protein required for cell wall assembly
VDEKTPQLTVVSLPRDTLAEIPGYGSDKINAALAYGGRDLAEQAVEQRLGVDIRYNALLGFHTTTELVDHLGGVFIDVDANMSYKGVSVSVGPQTLDGTHALTFARCRKELPRGDFHRVEHHRDLFIATFDKIVHSEVTDYPALAAELLPYLETNLPTEKAAHLLTIFKDYDATKIYEATAPSYSGSYNGGSYVFVEDEPWKVMLDRVNQGLTPVE